MIVCFYSKLINRRLMRTTKQKPRTKKSPMAKRVKKMVILKRMACTKSGHPTGGSR